jgi:hypothetical protein
VFRLGAARDGRFGHPDDRVPCKEGLPSDNAISRQLAAHPCPRGDRVEVQGTAPVLPAFVADDPQGGQLALREPGSHSRWHGPGGSQMAATLYAGLTIRAPLPASGGAGCAKTRRPASRRRPPLWSLRGELFEQPRQIVQPANDLAHALVFGHSDFPLSPSPRDAGRADTLGASAPVESCRQYPTGLLNGYFTTRIRLCVLERADPLDLASRIRIARLDKQLGLIEQDTGPGRPHTEPSAAV